MSDASAASGKRYAARIERVRSHIRLHLDAPLDLDELAGIACLSRFHWHRIYRAMTGETVADTVRRLRLARAAVALAQGDASTEDVARQAGYTSAAAFSRAFSSAYGQPPRAFRQTGPHADLTRARQENNAMAYNVEIRRLPERPALCLAHRGPYENVGASFDKLFLALGTEGLAKHLRGPFGVYPDDPDTVPADALKSFACAFVDGPGLTSETAQAMNFGGGLYAVLLYTGPYTSMRPAYDWLLGVWLPQSGREARDAPMLEINLNTPLDTPPQDLLTEICLPLAD